MEPFVKPTTQGGGASASLDLLFQGGAAPSQPDVQQSPEAEPQESGGGVLGELPTEGQEAAPEGQEAAPEGQEAAPTAEDWLEFNVTDGEGRKRVKVNVADRDQLTRILAQGYGFRKMQAERDQSRQAIAKMEPRLKELEESWGALSNAYDTAGIEGIVDLLGGKAGHFKEWKQKEFERELKFQTASQSEKDRILLEEKLAKLEKESALREKRAKEAETKAAQDREAAQLKSVEAQVTPAFNKVRFAGTLGDPAVEQAYDQAIWDQALKNLEALPDTLPMTQAIVEREFEKVASAFRKVIGQQANSKAKQVIEAKKKEAQSQVAAKVVSASKRSTSTDEMAKHVQRGGVSGLTDGLMSILRGR